MQQEGSKLLVDVNEMLLLVVTQFEMAHYET